MASSVTSRCECQAQLTASLDAERHVVEGSARFHGKTETAPAHSIAASASTERFDVAWLCPFCGRNTLRTFHVGAVLTHP